MTYRAGKQGTHDNVQPYETSSHCTSVTEATRDHYCHHHCLCLKEHEQQQQPLSQQDNENNKASSEVGNLWFRSIPHLKAQ